MKMIMCDSRKLCLILFLALLLCPVTFRFISSDLHITASAPSTPVVAVNPVNNTAEPGEYFTLEFNITDAVNLFGWYLELWWDVPMLLDIDKTNITEGAFLKAGGSTTFSSATHTSYDYYIEAMCRFTQAPQWMFNKWVPEPQNGSGVLASANFTVKGPGSHALTLRNVRLTCWNFTSQSTYYVYPTVRSGAFYTTTPYSHFTYSPDPSEPGNFGHPIVNETVTFNASESYDPDQPYKGQTGTGINSYEWNFDDGVTEVYVKGVNLTSIATHVYSVNRTYNVKLNVTDDDLQSKSWELPVKINLHDIAVINVTATPAEVVPGGLVEVNATVLNQGNFEEYLNVTVCANGVPVNTTFFTWYSWNDFIKKWVLRQTLRAGENGTTTIVWNTTDFLGRGIQTISVNASIIKFTAPNTYEKVPGLEQDLADNTYIDGEVGIGLHDIATTSVTCNATDVPLGQVVAINATVKNEGDFTETFNVTAYYAGVPIETQNVSLSAGANKTLTFYWNTTYVAAGTYAIKAEATHVPNEFNTTNNLYIDGDVTVHRKADYPVANFTYSPEKPLLGEVVTFNASASYDLNGYIVSYRWDFGDDNVTTVSTSTITHVYNIEGTYVVRLAVTDNQSLATGIEKTVRVCAYPVANFTYSPDEPVFNQTVTFDASVSDPKGGTIDSCAWDFGDGNVTTVSTLTITHEYVTFGNYTVTLTVTDSEDLSNSTSKLLKVCAPPVANFTYSPSLVEHPMRNETVTFNASISYDPDGYIVSYEWDFGDGTTEVYLGANLTATATHMYDSVGTQKVTLNVTDNDGFSDSYDTTITIYRAHDIAVVNVTLSSNTVFVGDTVFINATAKNVGDALETKARTFNVTLYYGDTVIDGQNVTDLASGATKTLTFTWVTAGVSPGDYTIRAVAYTKTREINTTNNELAEAIAVIGISEFSAYPTTITVGESTSLNGTVSPSLAGVSVTLQYSSAGETVWKTLGTLTTDSTGYYQYIWAPSTAGTYQVLAVLLEDDTVKVSSATLTIVVNKLNSTVSIDASSTSFTAGDEVVINGTVTPKRSGINVTLQYRRGDEAWSTLDTVTTDSNGFFSTSWRPSDAGTYEVKASWSGDENTASAESNVLVIEVVAGQNVFVYAVAGITILIVTAALFYLIKIRKPK